MDANAAAQDTRTPRIYLPSRLDRAFFSLQLFIGVLLLVGVAIGILSGAAGSSTTPSNPTDFPIGAVIGGLGWIALIAGYLVAGRGAVRLTPDGVDVVPYIGRAQQVPWSDITGVTVASTSPYAGGIYGVGSWVEVFLSRSSGHGIGLQATRRPKSQLAAVEAVRDAIANDVAQHR